MSADKDPNAQRSVGLHVRHCVTGGTLVTFLACKERCTPKQVPSQTQWYLILRTRTTEDLWRNDENVAHQRLNSTNGITGQVKLQKMRAASPLSHRWVKSLVPSALCGVKQRCSRASSCGGSWQRLALLEARLVAPEPPPRSLGLSVR